MPAWAFQGLLAGNYQALPMKKKQWIETCDIIVWVITITTHTGALHITRQQHKLRFTMLILSISLLQIAWLKVSINLVKNIAGSGCLTQLFWMYRNRLSQSVEFVWMSSLQDSFKTSPWLVLPLMDHSFEFARQQNLCVLWSEATRPQSCIVHAPY